MRFKFHTYKVKNEAKIESIWLNPCTCLPPSQVLCKSKWLCICMYICMYTYTWELLRFVTETQIYNRYNRTPTDKRRRVSPTSLIFRRLCSAAFSSHIWLAYRSASFWGIISLEMYVVFWPGLDCATFGTILKNVGVCYTSVFRIPLWLLLGCGLLKEWGTDLHLSPSCGLFPALLLIEWGEHYKQRSSARLKNGISNQLLPSAFSP